MENHTAAGLKEALSFLEAGNPIQAKKVLDNSLIYELDSKELIFTGKCCLYWQEIIVNVSKISNSFDRGEQLLSEWKNFQTTYRQYDWVYEPAMSAVCHGVFSLALQNFNSLLAEKDESLKAEILRKVGLCYKKLGEFDNAKMILSEANKLKEGQAAVIADLADCYALCGNDKASKALFKEAFFIDYEKVDLDFLDSQLITRLIKKTEEKGYKGDELKAWIPVYGVLWGVFNIKRAMKSREVSRLRQDIYALEMEIRDPSRANPYQTPRLLNLYFWLIDYCQSAQEDKLINEILLKIKILDTYVYNLYVK